MEKFKVGDLVLISNIEPCYKELLGDSIGKIGKIIGIHKGIRNTTFYIVSLSLEEIKFKEDELLLIKRQNV